MATASALALTACGGGGDTGDGGASSGGDVTLTFAWWGDVSRAERYEQSVDLFEEANPGVTVQTSFAGWGDYWQARNTEAAGGALPDVMQMDIAYLSVYGGNDRLAALDDAIGATIDTSTIAEAVLPAGQLEGTTYAITSSTNTLATFVNTDLLAELGVAAPEAGLTWAGYNDFLREVAAAGADSSPQVYGSVDYTQIFWLFNIWLGQQGLSMFDQDGALGFTADDLTEWWSLTADLRAENVVMPPDVAAQLSGADAIGSQQAVSEISWDNFLVRFSEGSGGATLAMLPPPADDPASSGLFLKPSLMLAASANSAHPEEAAALIDFLVNDAQVSEIFGTSRGVPASSSALDAVVAEGLDAQILDYEDSIADSLTDTPPPPVDGFGSLEESFVRIHEELAYGTVTTAEAADQWFAEAEDTLRG
ncbi:extracellular solute-binding protein [Occultella glacieicola]|uniref:Extracellular solute-binding protein n=1 Tax=Occultella glacieicola TaxID=2518684 RepID=A0ABY2E4Y3_9MICO|nr:extracellular solute-binding protein [Occultella glacieicola]TDE94951.1 extracellular solute-binding protein [Occultella glacieicola]